GWLEWLTDARHIRRMPRPPKDPDRLPKPRASRGKSGKPPAPPPETAAGTPQTRAFAEAPQAAFDAGAGARPTLPALRQQGPRPPMPGESVSRYLDALLAKPSERSARANEILQQQPMLATHPLVSGNQPMFMPHRPPRPEKSEGGVRFNLVSEYEPKGDQPSAIAELVSGVNANERSQVLLGVTGSGKTYTMAQVVAATQRPALVLAPNKTLAAQL